MIEKKMTKNGESFLVKIYKQKKPNDDDIIMKKVKTKRKQRRGKIEWIIINNNRKYSY